MMGRGDPATGHDSIASRRQTMNDDAYKAVLQTLFARNQTDAKAMLLMQKLRKELNIAPENHRAWLQQLQAAKQQGTLMALLAGGLHVHAAQPQQPAPVAKARSAGPARHRRVVNDNDTASDTTVSAGTAQQAMVQRGGWQQPAVSQQQERPAQAFTERQRATASQKQHVAEVDIPPLLGFKVQRYWPKEGKWFDGIITDRRAKDGFYCITYNLGKRDESHEWFDIESAAAVDNPQVSFYQLTAEKIDLKRFANTRAFQSSSVLSGGDAKKAGAGGKSSSMGITRKRAMS